MHVDSRSIRRLMHNPVHPPPSAAAFFAHAEQEVFQALTSTAGPYATRPYNLLDALQNMKIPSHTPPDPTSALRCRHQHPRLRTLGLHRGRTQRHATVVHRPEHRCKAYLVPPIARRHLRDWRRRSSDFLECFLLRMLSSPVSIFAVGDTLLCFGLSCTVVSASHAHARASLVVPEHSILALPSISCVSCVQRQRIRTFALFAFGIVFRILFHPPALGITPSLLCRHRC